MMERVLSIKRGNLRSDIFLIIIECILFFSIIIFFILLFITHPPNVWTCIVVETKAWVMIYSILYDIFIVVAYSIYYFKIIKNLNSRISLNPLRFGNTVLFMIFLLVYNFLRRCISYQNLANYVFLMFLSTLLPTIYHIIIVNKSKKFKTTKE